MRRFTLAAALALGCLAFSPALPTAEACAMCKIANEDGTGFRATPLWLIKQGPDILFSFEDLGPAPMAYHVYEGAVRSIGSHDSLACSQAGTPSSPGRRAIVLAPSPGDRYYLMTAANCAGEGPSGADPSRSTCPP